MCTHSRNREDTRGHEGASDRVQEDTQGNAGTAGDTRYGRFGTARPRGQIPAPRPKFPYLNWPMRKARGWLLYLYSGQLATFDLDPLDQSAVPWPFDVGVRIRVAASGIADVRECGLCALLMHVVVPRVVSIIDGSRKPRTDHLRAVMGCGRDRGSWIRFGPGSPWRCFRGPGWPLCGYRSSVRPVGRPRRPVTYFLGRLIRDPTTTRRRFALRKLRPTPIRRAFPYANRGRGEGGTEGLSAVCNP